MLIQNNSLLSWYYKLRDFSWKFWFHLLQLYQTICLSILVDTPDIKVFPMNVHLYGRNMEFFIM